MKVKISGLLLFISFLGCDFGLDAPYEDANGIYLNMLSNVKVNGNILLIDKDKAYVFYKDTLNVFDISDKLNPLCLNIPGLGKSIKDAKISGPYIYAISDDYFIVLNVSSTPYIIGELGLFGYYCREVEIDGNYAYVRANDDYNYAYLLIIDISSPSKPVLINTICFSGNYVYDYMIENGIGYLLVGDDIEVYDFSELLNPQKSFEISYYGIGRKVAKNGEYLYICDNSITVMKLITSKQLKEVRYISFPAGITDLDFDKYGVASDGTTLYLLNIEIPSYLCVSEKTLCKSIRLKTHGDYIYSLSGQDLTILKVQQIR